MDRKPRTDLDAMLWEAGRQAPEGGPADVSAESWAAYRAGTLSPEEAARVERAVADDPALRRVLIDAAVDEPTATLPPEALLATPTDAAAAVGSSTPANASARRRFGGARRLYWLGAGLAAALLLTVGLALGWPAEPSRARPVPQHRVDVHGESERRSTPTELEPAPEQVQVTSEGSITIRAQAIQPADDRTYYGVYTRADRGLRRLPVEPRVGQGVAIWRVPVADLSAPASGRRVVWVRIGRTPAPARAGIPRIDEGSTTTRWYRHEVELIGGVTGVHTRDGGTQ